MATIKFYIQSKKHSSGIYVRLREGRKVDAKAKTRFIINPEDWSTAKGRPKNLHNAIFKKLNSDLNDFATHLLNHYNAKDENTMVNSGWLKEFIKPKTEVSEIPKGLVSYFEYYRGKKKSTLSKASLTKLNVVSNFLKDFENIRNKVILIEDVNEDFMNEFLSYSLENDYGQNYIARNFSFIKTICYDAEINGLTINSHLRKLKIKEVETVTIYLSEKEINTIEQLNLKDRELDTVRDWLLISCETGQRISDFLSFSKTMLRIEKNRNGKDVHLLEFIQQKTKKLMSIPLSTKVRGILQKRDGEFPDVISSQRFNEVVKNICKKAGLMKKEYGGLQNPLTKRKEFGDYPKWKLVSGHIGRRSFATNNFGKIPTPLIMAATGHTTEKEFLKYIGKTDTQKALHLSEYIN